MANDSDAVLIGICCCHGVACGRDSRVSFVLSATPQTGGNGQGI